MFKVHINQLPNECLTMIFKNFDLQKMILFRVICLRWQELIEAICKGKQSLKILKPPYLCLSPMLNQEIDGFLKSKQPLDCYLNVIRSNLDSQLCDFLVDLFPNIEHLVFHRALINHKTVKHLCDMFQKLTNLKSFYLFGGPDSKRSNGKSVCNIDKNVLQVIGQLHLLRNLYLCTHKLESPLPNKIVSQLDHLFLGARCYAAFVASLTQLKPACTVRIEMYPMYDSLFKQLSNLVAKTNYQFLLKVTHLTLHHISISLRDLRYITQHLINLQFIKIKYYLILVSIDFILF